MRQFYFLIFMSLFYLFSIFISSSLHAFNIELSDTNLDNLNIVEGISNFFKEEDDYIKFQNINYFYTKTHSPILSKDVLSDTFSSITSFQSTNRYLTLYNKIHSFFKENQLSFYNSNSYEQGFLKDDIDIFDDWKHMSYRLMHIDIITDQNRLAIQSDLKRKTFSYGIGSDITTTHNYFLDNNLVGMIEGTDEFLKKEFTVIGMSLKKPRAYISDLYANDINQILTTSIFLSIIKNILDHKDSLKRSILFVVFPEEYLHIGDKSEFFHHDSNHNRYFNGAKAFLDYFDYYNNTININKEHSIYSFINIEPLSYDLFLKNKKDIPQYFLSNLLRPSSEYLNFLQLTVKDINSLYNINYTTNNDTLGSILKTSSLLYTSYHPVRTANLATVFPADFLAYNFFNDKDISSLLFGSNPFLKDDNLKLTEQQTYTLINNYIDLDKLDSFTKTILAVTSYLSIRNPELDLSQTKNPCSIYFE